MRLLHQYGSFLASCSSRSSSSCAPPVHSFCLPPVSNYEAAAPQVSWLCNLGGGCCFSRASECSRAVGKNGKTLGNSLGLQNNKKVMKGFKASSVQPPAGDEADVYAAIFPTLSRAAASVLEVGDLNGNACHLLDKSKKEQVCLFYCSETEDLARRIAAESYSIQLKSIRWGAFPDGFPDLFVPNARGFRSQHVAFLASFSSPDVIFEQLSIIYALPRMFVSSFTVVLPFFPTGTLERMEDEGDIATAFTLARILSDIPISRGGPTSLVIFDIHALQERFYFGDNVLPCFESGIPLLKHRIHQLPDSSNVSIAFPDEGAWKRFNKQLQHFPTVICTKVRDGNERIVKLKEGDPQGRHVIIVDDLVQSGSTLIECQMTDLKVIRDKWRVTSKFK
ncbi:hypothetical protein CY35_10G063700 [Sphagnum magellanicum]|nr:hypothetical protein CY35_10G063700 [Sphagnum magellanicum]KAH9550285.1 hypothetical protein CY35_10G063700 [Sphagnum magellanicum]